MVTRVWLFVVLAGCSFALQGPAPHRARTAPPACDSGKGLVTLDGVVAAGLAIVAIAVAGSNDSNLTALPALGGALYIASALRGNNVANSCREAMNEFAESRAPEPRDDLRSLARPAVAVQQPRAEPAQPQQQQPQPPAAAPPPPAQVDAWREFWRVVP